MAWETGRVVGLKEAEWRDKACRRGGWMAGAAAAVSSLTCAPAPYGLFPASSCGASWPQQHPPLLGLKRDWLAFSQPDLLILSSHSTLPAQGTRKHWAGCRFSEIVQGIFQQPLWSILAEKSTIFKDVGIAFNHIWPREMQVLCFPFELRLL